MISIEEAKKNWASLVARAEAGEEVVITRDDKPVARLVPFTPVKPVRKPGMMKGKVKITPAFYEADKEIERMFYGEED